MEKSEEFAMLLLSCDAYSDLWDNFFNLQEKFWPDCKYAWYVVTESKKYERKNVKAIRCGNDLNWSGRLRMAVQTVDTPYISFMLDDNFINAKIDDKRIDFLLNFAISNQVDYLDMGNVFRHKLDLREKEYFADSLLVIPKHLRYGIDTAAAIWKKEYLLDRLGEGDYSAWEFEVNMCSEAASTHGYAGRILVDEQMSFNVTPIPVVIQGKYYPKAIKDFHKRGYEIVVGERKIMTPWECFKYVMKCKISNFPFGHRFLKAVGRRLGYKFFTS